MLSEIKIIYLFIYFQSFNYFIKKLKRIYNNCFPYQSSCYKNKPTPWLTSGILKSIKQKNKLFIKTKTNPTLKSGYKNIAIN